MAMGLNRRETVAHGARRLLRKQLAAALGLVARDPPDAIHELRKASKSLRALCRLLREAIGDRAFHDANERLRDLAAPLGGPRDTEALLTAIDALAGRSKGLRAQLASTKRALRTQQDRDELDRKSALRAAGRAIEALARRSGKWQLGGAGWKTLSAGLRRTQRTAQAAMKSAAEQGGDVQLHEWRKQVKYLRAELSVLEKMAPAPLRARIELLNELSDRLGDDHDLAVLAQRLDSLCPGAAARRAIRHAIDARRESLQAESFALGREGLAQKPQALARSLRDEWRRWRG